MNPDRILLPHTDNLRGATSAWTRSEPTLSPLVACGNGHIATTDDHEIDAHGNVTPSLKCPAAGCDWHVWAVLEGWAG